MPTPATEAERQVLELLTAMGFNVESGRRIGGYEPDFIVRSTDGKTIVFEVKGWAPDQEHIDRATQQVRLYQRALGADAGFVVMPQLAEGVPKQGVLSLEDLLQLPRLLAELPVLSLQPNDPFETRASTTENGQIVFAAMLSTHSLMTCSS